VYNFYDRVRSNPDNYRQLRCGEALITLFNCPLATKFNDLWSHHNYIVYVVEGKKVWHLSQGSVELKAGDCFFVRRGAAIVEQFFDSVFCIVLFFIPDDFIRDVLKTRVAPLASSTENYRALIPIHRNPAIEFFFQSMNPFFANDKAPDPSLLELKFRELILTVADEPRNGEMLAFFHALKKQPHALSLRKIMEDNFCFNLKLEEFARLCNRSLSAFKRDFESIYGMPPGKWLLSRRLEHAMHLLSNEGSPVSDAAYQSGFEDTSHFSRSFRKYFGVAPNRARGIAA
jgi:AraC-like DNA-binding protein